MPGSRWTFSPAMRASIGRPEVPARLPGAGRAGRAVGEEGVELGVEGRRLVHAEADGILGRVDGAVEDHGPDVGREQLGVGGAEEGPVGEAEVGELGVADGLADLVHVPGRVVGADMGEQVGAHGLAAGHELAVALDQGVEPGVGRRRRIQTEVLVELGPVAQWTGALRATPRGSKPTRSKCSDDRRRQDAHLGRQAVDARTLRDRPG